MAAGLVMDVSPTLALRVKQVDGVFDCTTCLAGRCRAGWCPCWRPRSPRRWNTRAGSSSSSTPTAQRGACPGSSSRSSATTAVDPSALVFTVQGERLAIPLQHVVQVIEANACFNRAPNAGSFLGVAVHRAQLCPVFTVGPLGLVQPFVVLFEVNGDLLGLSASQVEGVRSGGALGGASILDVGRMFS